MLFEIKKKKKDKIQSHGHTAVIKDYKWFGLTNRNVSKSWRLEGPNQGFSRAGSFWGPGETLFHAFLQLLGVCWPSLVFLGFCCITPTSAFILP